MYDRLDEDFVKQYGKRKACHKGRNSSCRLHLYQHYEEYKEKCERANVPINHWAIPREIWKVLQAEKDLEKQGKQTKKKIQQTLDFEAVTGPREFTRENVLNAVAKLIASNNQVCFSPIATSRKNLQCTNSPLHWLTILRFEIPSLQ